MTLDIVEETFAEYNITHSSVNGDHNDNDDDKDSNNEYDDNDDGDDDV